MKSITGIISLVVLLCVSQLYAQQTTAVVKRDLRQDWMVFEDNEYKLLAENQAPGNTIYCRIEPAVFAGDYLRITSVRPFALFMNGKLASAEATSGLFAIDSLRKIFPGQVLLIGLHQKNIRAGDVGMQIESRVANDASFSPVLVRQDSFFRDFAIVALLLLLALIAVIIRLNPKLASDYFSVSKIFSVREIDDSQVYTRISSSTNILFYLAVSLMIGFCLMVIFQFTFSIRSIGFAFQSTHFWSAFFQWIGLSLIILGVFLFKILLVYGVSSLFGLRDIAGIHFFNWVRILLIGFSLITIVLSVYFVARGQSESFYNFLMGIVTVMLSTVAAVVFLKLKGRSAYSFFHLFSYICATEIIPLLITVKILYQ